MDEQSDEADKNDEADAEDDNDTRLAGSPVAALGDEVEGVADDNGALNGRHFVMWIEKTRQRAEV